jgi:ribosomal protein S18 acetylase RimI-like enzyme
VPSRIPRGRRQQAVATIVAAFIDDPVERWLFPDRDRYLACFPEFATAFGQRAFDEDTAWTLDDAPAVALWLAPGVQSDGEAIVASLTDSVAPEKHAEMFSVLDQMDRAHPTFAHWYLPWLAVEPGAQGRGCGGRLLEQSLAVVDESGLPAYLETPNPRTISFYTRHGFEVTAEAQAGSCPPMTLMLRAGVG